MAAVLWVAGCVAAAALVTASAVGAFGAAPSAPPGTGRADGSSGEGVGVGGAAGHVFAGAETAGPAGGVEADLGVAEPSFAPGAAGDEFVADWVMANDQSASGPCRDLGGSDLIQAGWVSAPGPDPTPEVFEYDSASCAWTMFPQYRLVPGRAVGFRVVGVGGGVWEADIRWGGAWRELVSARMPWASAPWAEVQEEAAPGRPGAARWPSVAPHPVSGAAVEAGGVWRTWSAAPSVSSASGGWCVRRAGRSAWSAGTCGRRAAG